MFFGYGSSTSISSPFESSIFSITAFDSDERELELDEYELEFDESTLELELELELKLELDENERDQPDLPERVGLFSILKPFKKKLLSQDGRNAHSP